MTTGSPTNLQHRPVVPRRSRRRRRYLLLAGAGGLVGFVVAVLQGATGNLLSEYVSAVWTSHTPDPQEQTVYPDPPSTPRGSGDPSDAAELGTQPPESRTASAPNPRADAGAIGVLAARRPAPDEQFELADGQQILALKGAVAITLFHTEVGALTVPSLRIVQTGAPPQTHALLNPGGVFDLAPTPGCEPTRLVVLGSDVVARTATITVTCTP